MSVKITWSYDPSVSVTDYKVYRSTDNGVTYTLVSTIAFDVNGANYDKAERQFFYTDAGGAAGYVYKVTATGANGTSKPVYTIVPPGDPPTCLVIGYVTNVFGQKDLGQVHIDVQGYGSRGELWAPNASGVVANSQQAMGLASGLRRVFLDENGMWQVELVRKTLARITIPALDLDWAFEVPDREGPVNIRDIPCQRGADFETTFGDNAGVRNPITRA
jgi:hypothetical protein